MPSAFEQVLSDRQLRLDATTLATLQINITKLCNQACHHCHVDSSPKRTEKMDRAGVDRCLQILKDTPGMQTLDLTGGAPELHPDFDDLVKKARALGKHVIIRHNLTVQTDGNPVTKESKAYLPEFFASQKVEVVSSLPYHQEFFTDKQRGKGVFKKSLDALLRLNEVGYGRPGTGLILNLVYNPVGAYLPAAQAQLEKDYKKELGDRWGIHFNSLFTITNMPIHRFKSQLQKTGSYDEYMGKLQGAFNPTAAENVMCRTLVSVGYDGKLYDCDFNQMLEMPIVIDGEPQTIFNFDPKRLASRAIRFDDHCFGCTAGAGSSCGGATSN